MKIDKLQPGMILYDVRKATGPARFSSKFQVYPVKIIEVDLDKRRVLVSWNNNPAWWISEERAEKYRKKQPSSIT